MTVTSGEDKKNVVETDPIDLSELDRLDEIENAERAAAEPQAVKRLKTYRRSGFEWLASKFREPRSLTVSRLAFFLGGFVFAVWAAMVPYVKQYLGLDEGEMGLLLLCLGLGALLAMPATGGIVGRFGCRRVLRWAVPATMACGMLLAASTQVAVTAVCLFSFGVTFGIMDVAMSIHAVEVEKRLKKPVLSGVYAFYPIGGVAGALVMSALLNLGFPAIPCVIVLMTLAQFAWTATGSWVIATAGRSEVGAPKFVLPKGRVLLYGAVVFVLYLADGAVLDWGGLLLSSEQGASIENAAMGYASFSVAMMIMRLVGGKVVTFLGPRRTVVIGSLLGAASFCGAVLLANPYISVLLFFFVGLGASNITPLTFSEAGRTKSMPMSAALAAVSTLGYSGVLVGPAMIGGIAHATSLPTAFYFVAFLLVLTAFAGFFYPGKSNEAATQPTSSADARSESQDAAEATNPQDDVRERAENLETLEKQSA